LDELYAEYSEWFNLQSFPIEEQLLLSETAVFCAGAGAPADIDFTSVENYYCFSGLRAVIRHRLDQRSLEQIKLAAELFSWTVDFGLFSSDQKAYSELRVGSAEDVMCSRGGFQISVWHLAAHDPRFVSSILVYDPRREPL